VTGAGAETESPVVEGSETTGEGAGVEIGTGVGVETGVVGVEIGVLELEGTQ